MKSKNFLTKLIALIISLVSLVGVLSGCQLVNTKIEEDSNLKVMTIQIEKEVEPITFKKSDLYSAYVSYGYYYVNNYGYSIEDTYNMIISNYQQNAVVEQFARIKLAELYNEVSADTYIGVKSEFEEKFLIPTVSANLAEKNLTKLEAKADLDLFLSTYQKAEALYNVKSSINSLIDSFLEEDEHDHDHEEEEEKESVSLEERANPFVEEEEEELEEWELQDKEIDEEKDLPVAAKKLGEDVELSIGDIKDLNNNNKKDMYDLNMHVFTTYQIDISTNERAKAFNTAINSYRSLGIITNEFYTVLDDPKTEDVNEADNALKYEYFAKQLKDEKAQMLVLSYQNSLVKEVESKLSVDSLYADYVNMFYSQKDKYTSNSADYETVLNQLTKDTLLVYNPYSGYGFVTNLLLGFSDEQSAQLAAYKTKLGVTKEEVEDFRDNLALSILVKDQRLSWATSGKMVKDENDNTVFEDKYFLSEYGKANLNTFIGELENVTESTEEDANGIEKTNYFATNGYADGINIMDFLTDYFYNAFEDENDYIKGYSDNKEEIDNVMKDFIYAFSTDKGSLSVYKGYMYSPITSKTTYVDEFAAAAKELVEVKGVGSYDIVVTDYGVHIMMCTEVVAPSSADPMTLTQFEEALKNGDEFVTNFKKVKQDTLVDSYVSEMANSFVKKYLEEDSKATTFYKDNYKDLV